MRSKIPICLLCSKAPRPRAEVTLSTLVIMSRYEPEPEPSDLSRPKIDVSRPHSARMYDYYLGGKDHFEADRLTAEKALRSWAAVRTGVRENRAFLGRAVRYLAEEAGIRKFLDIGTGLPRPESHKSQPKSRSQPIREHGARRKRGENEMRRKVTAAILAAVATAHFMASRNRCRRCVSERLVRRISPPCATSSGQPESASATSAWPRSPMTSLPAGDADDLHRSTVERAVPRTMRVPPALRRRADRRAARDPRPRVGVRAGSPAPGVHAPRDHPGATT